MITKEQALIYEVGSLCFLQSILYNHFYKYFIRRFEKKYKRYQYLMDNNYTREYLKEKFS